MLAWGFLPVMVRRYASIVAYTPGRPVFGMVMTRMEKREKRKEKRGMVGGEAIVA
jgi:hypothetical protein